MGNDARCQIPMIILLFDRPRRIDVEAVRRVVRAEQSEAAASSVWNAGENPSSMEYICWKFGATSYHLGTALTSFNSTFGQNEHKESNPTGSLDPSARHHSPPEDKVFRNAWISHVAWMYVDAVLADSPRGDDQLHLRHVFTIAGHFVDEHCVLLWRWEMTSKQFALPTAQAVASLRTGEWPG